MTTPTELDTRLKAELPEVLRPAMPLGDLLESCRLQGWKWHQIIDKLHDAYKPSHVVTVLRDMATGPPRKDLSAAVINEVLNPPNKWAWCELCQGAGWWLAAPKHLATSLCNHHRYHYETIMNDQLALFP